jgi:hypothetical protein
VAGLHLVLNTVLLILILSLVTYRVTRFIILDSLIERWREHFYEFILDPLDDADMDLVLTLHEDGPLHQLPWWRRKIYQLFSCPFCISVWVAGGAVALTEWLTDFDVVMPVWTWLAISALSLVVYTYIDAED